VKDGLNNPISIEYIAGFFDGEGCITSHYRKNNTMTKDVTIAQKDPTILYEIQDFFDVGYVWENSCVWGVNGARDIELVLNALLPYLRIKKHRAELMLEICSMVRGSGWRVPPEHHARRRELGDQIRALNGRQGK